MRKARTALSVLIVAGVAGWPETGRTQEPRCLFTTAPASGAPTILGPDEVTSRLHLLAQPSSPVEIVSADFTGSRLLIEEGALARSYSFQHKAVVEVRNRSDQLIERVDVGLMPGVCQGAGPRPRPSWTGSLLPGETTRIQLGSGSGGGSGSAGTGMGPLLVWAWIERVDFNDCAYRPAQILPKALCDGGPSNGLVRPR